MPASVMNISPALSPCVNSNPDIFTESTESDLRLMKDVAKTPQLVEKLEALNSENNSPLTVPEQGKSF